MLRSLSLVLLLLPLWMVPPAAAAEWADVVDGGESMPGFVPLFWRADEGKLYAEIGPDQLTPFIYYTGLSQGVGSNDLGLDRGRLGDNHLVQFERHGPRLLLVALNTRYIADSENPRERAAVAEAFATSVLWGFDVVAEREGRALIDMTAFVQRDATGVGSLLARRGEGAYKVDASRSAVYLPRTKAFPDNTEIDAIVTLTGEPKGNILATVVPDASAVTVHKHHSFVRLPEPGYEPLPYDPRMGFIDGDEDLIFDYATPIDAPIHRGYARRHRLQKVDPNAAVSPAVEPIVYYVDPGVPEPIRGALIEGASWWNQAFTAAGFENAFQVKLLPEGADPMDVRYNVIQWVHRSTRGWSYGSSIRDPRTQEIIKGHVTLGSLRVRQDFLLAEGLLAPYGNDEDDARMREFALARIRQLSAHEVGHTLGLEHNFAASADGRASVMDYPHPLVTLDDEGGIDLSNAYAEGIGEWDKRAITWGYREFAPGVDAAEAREQLVVDTLASGLRFIDDAHSRVSGRESAGPAHPRSSLWDNGDDPVVELNRLMALRGVVLDNFSEAVIRVGMPMARIEDALVPAYLMHRYQVEAAATVLGGREFNYALRGDGQTPTAIVPAEAQRAALEALLATLDPEALLLSPKLIAMIPPRPPQSAPSRELFPRETGYLFDPVAVAATAAQLTVGELLDHRRAARLDSQRLLDLSLPGFADVVDALRSAVFAEQHDDRRGVIERRLQVVTVDALMALLGNMAAPAQARGTALAALQAIAETAARGAKRGSPEWRAHHGFTAARIASGLAAEGLFATKSTTIPPGSPI